VRSAAVAQRRTTAPGRAELRISRDAPPPTQASDNHGGNDWAAVVGRSLDPVAFRRRSTAPNSPRLGRGRGSHNAGTAPPAVPPTRRLSAAPKIARLAAGAVRAQGWQRPARRTLSPTRAALPCISSLSTRGGGSDETAGSGSRRWRALKNTENQGLRSLYIGAIMINSMRSALRSAAVLVPVLLSVAVPGRAQHIVSSTLLASLRSGSLAGTSFTVSFSYDASQASPQGQVFLQLITFSFTLRGIPFTRNEIFQGGKVILRDGVREISLFRFLLRPCSLSTRQ
jgi:hypothetical protein